MDGIKRFIPLAILVTFLCGLVYVAVHQTLRLSANDPQIQLAEDTAAQLSTQVDKFLITKLPTTDIEKSLAPFVIVYNADGKAVSSSGNLDGKTPIVPPGVLAYTKEHQEDRFTWEPKQGIRIAAVIRHFSGRTSGYVLAGRSLREVEIREQLLLKNVQIAWFATLVTTFLACVIFQERKKK